MIENVHHSCGIAAISYKDKKKNVVPDMYRLLINMQNRGQLSAGLTTFQHDRAKLLKRHRDIGGVNEVFRVNRPEKMQNLYNNFKGHSGIGHVRYATCGANDRNYAQPFIRPHGRKYKWFSMCFNGNITNYYDLKEEMMKKTDYHLVLDSDTEVIMHKLSKQLNDQDSNIDMIKVFTNLSKKFDGAYNIAMMNGHGEIYICRDPNGLRPLVYAETKDGVFVASESSALINVGIFKFKDVNPGDLLIIKDGKLKIKQFAKPKRVAHCMFEWIYFANASSVLDKKSVYMTRSNLGRELAKEEKLKMTKDHIVVPVPDSAKTSAQAMAFELGIPVMEGLMRNRYLGRTFIESQSRDMMIKNKFMVIKEIVKGKKVLLVDDSIVRGTTMKHLIKYIKEDGGAKEVHLRIACPAVMAPCFYGIDMATKSELLVPHYAKNYCGEITDEDCVKIAKDLGADSLNYISHKGLVDSIGLPKEELCMACLNCDYPTKAGREMYEIANKRFLEGKPDDERVIKTRTC